VFIEDIKRIVARVNFEPKHWHKWKGSVAQVLLKAYCGSKGME